MHRLVIILFPIILVPWEAGVRHLLTLPLWDFVGPTLCVAGLSILVSLTKVQKILVEKDGKKLTAVKEGDVAFIILLFIILLTFLFAWAAAYFFSQPHNASYFLFVPVHALIGIAVYVISCIVYSIREAVDG